MINDAVLTDSPTAWFCVLERARRTGQQDMELRAARELRRLGVTVRFSQPKAGQRRPQRKGH